MEGSYVSLAVAAAGDVNGDGYDDVLAGQAGYRDHPKADLPVGRVLLYEGGPCGLSRGPSWMVIGGSEGTSFGDSVATAGDVDGDGYADIVVGAPSSPPHGRAFIYLGSRDGLSTEPASTLGPDPDEPHSSFGTTVASAGDVDGGGFSDVAVAVCRMEGFDCHSDALLYLGTSDGVGATAAWTARQDNTQFDSSEDLVVPAGDVNGDRFSDLILVGWVHASGLLPGRAFLYLGSVDGLSREPAWSAGEGDAGLWQGDSVASAGDVDGDGMDDVVVGGSAMMSGYGAFLYRGSREGLSSEPITVVETSEIGPSYVVVAAGDIDGDGLGDVIVGTPWHENGEEREGAVRLYLGSAAGLARDPIWSAEGDEDQAYLGEAVVSAGDVDGDGLGDLLVAAREGGLGGAYTFRLFLGSAIAP